MMRKSSKILAVLFLTIAGVLYFFANRMNEAEVLAAVELRLPALVAEREQELAALEAALEARFEAMHDSLAQTHVYYRLHADTVEQVLKSMGVAYERGVDTYDDPKFEFKLAAHNVSLYFHGCEEAGCTSLRVATCFLQDVPISAEVVNAWNTEKRFSTAYRNDKGNACLDTDLIVAGGVTTGAVEQFLFNFRDRLGEYAAHLSESS